jgi:hypothetical protein
MWPRFRLTPDEAKYSSKYEDPGKTTTPVIRRMYYGFVNMTPSIRQDQETFQISRRSRLFALTASGDINMVEVQISDITGEQYTTDYIPLADLLGGSIYDPRGAEIFTLPIQFPGLIPIGFQYGALTFNPLIFEPNIALAPNQTITINARPINPLITADLHVSLCFHVYEFPGMPGSPF